MILTTKDKGKSKENIKKEKIKLPLEQHNCDKSIGYFLNHSEIKTLDFNPTNLLL